MSNYLEQFKREYWRPEPRFWGWRGISLLLPSLASALGFFCFAVLAFSFTELRGLDAGFRRMGKREIERWHAYNERLREVENAKRQK